MPAYEFNLNVDPGGMPPVIHLAQYDTGRTYYAKLKQGGEYYYLGLGVTAKIKGRNARGVCWEQECTVDTSLTYKVSFTPEGAATDQFGIMPVQMELTDGQGVISTLLMVWDIQRAGYTSEEAVTSPEFETALEEAVAAAIAQQGLGFTEEFKQALLACFNNVAWATPDGQSLVNDLEDALYPEVHFTSITADYEQDRPILDTDSLDLVRLDLVVTANYSDGTSETLADDAYTLTGTLVAPSSTITVGYGGKTDSVDVVVTSSLIIADIVTLDGIKNTRNGHSASATGWQDLSGNNNDFSKYGSAAITWGDDHCIFNATDNRVLSLSKNLLSGKSKLTVELVAKVTGNGEFLYSGTHYGGIVAQDDWGNSGNYLRFTTSELALASRWYGTALGANTSSGIMYIALVFDGTNCKKYYNGVLDNTYSCSFPPSTPKSDYYIGGAKTTAKSSANVYYFGMSGSELSAEDIAARYNAFKSRFHME